MTSTNPMQTKSNVDVAEELTQETFYQAVKSIHRYNGECKMSDCKTFIL